MRKRSLVVWFWWWKASLQIVQARSLALSLHIVSNIGKKLADQIRLGVSYGRTMNTIKIPIFGHIKDLAGFTHSKLKIDVISRLKKLSKPTDFFCQRCTYCIRAQTGTHYAPN